MFARASRGRSIGVGRRGFFLIGFSGISQVFSPIDIQFYAIMSVPEPKRAESSRAHYPTVQAKAQNLIAERYIGEVNRAS